MRSLTHFAGRQPTLLRSVVHGAVALAVAAVAGCGTDDGGPASSAGSGGISSGGGAGVTGGATASGGASGAGGASGGGAGAGGATGGVPSLSDVDLTLGGLNQDLPAPAKDCLSVTPAPSIACFSVSGTWMGRGHNARTANKSGFV
jgi:hypothetical protein